MDDTSVDLDGFGISGQPAARWYPRLPMYHLISRRAIRSCSVRSVSSRWGLTFNRTSSLRCCTSADGMVGVTTIETTAACAPTLLVSVPRRGPQTGDGTPMGPQKTRAESRRLCPPDSNRYALKTHCAHMKSDEKRTLLADSYKTRLSLSNDDLKLMTLRHRSAELAVS